MSTNVQKIESAEAPKTTPRQHILQIPVAQQAYLHHSKRGKKADALRSGLNRAGIGTDDVDTAEMRREIPRNEIHGIDEQLAKVRHPHWQGVDPDKFRTEPPTPSSKTLADLNAELAASAAIDAAYGSDEDYKFLIGEALKAFGNGAEFDLSAIKSGGRSLIMPTTVTEISVMGNAIDTSGEEHRKIPVFASAGVPIPNFGGLILNYMNRDGELAEKIFAQLKKEIGDSPQISYGERPRLKAEAAQRILAAQRRHEVACLDEELDGKSPMRPAETPWFVLLWCEPDPNANTAQVVGLPNGGRRTVHPDGTITGGSATEVRPMPGYAEPIQKRRMVNPGDKPSDLLEPETVAEEIAPAPTKKKRVVNPGDEPTHTENEPVLAEDFGEGV